jgi:hypothetical protein
MVNPTRSLKLIITISFGGTLMKKTVSFLAMAVMILTLSGCMDDPNQGNPKPKGYGTPNQEGTGVK